MNTGLGPTDVYHIDLPASCNINEEDCSIPIPQSELDQSKVGLIKPDRHVGHVIWIVLVRLRRQLSSGTAKAVQEQLELLGVTGKTVKDGYRLIRNCLRAVTDGFGAQKQLWDGYGQLRPRREKEPRERKTDRKEREMAGRPIGVSANGRRSVWRTETPSDPNAIGSRLGYRETMILDRRDGAWVLIIDRHTVSDHV
ncbi:hypothetical protein F2Q69_00037073 [Brassica cretica]|uniref:Uncharacterized protein n=1 Tax=Brassica cretica TaxID=69181 RepID=A0A8S9SN24_BRACR|nr:hypothetical protein F2Q69_00037073 [Brassica cretica]